VATIDPEHPPWAQPPWLGALWGFLIWLASVASLLFVPLILVIPYLIYKMTTAPGQVVMTQLENDKIFLFLSVLGVIPAHIVTFLFCAAIVTGWRKYPIGKTLGLSWPSSWGPIKGTLICVLIAAALFGGGALITWLFPGDKTQLDLLIESSNGARVVTAFLAIVTAPVVEEIVYRGILYPAINGVLGSAVAIGLVSLFFAAVHFLQYKNNLAVIGVITLVSITLTAVRAYTRRLLPCLVIHLVFNGIQAVIILLYPFLPKPETAPQPTPGELLPFVIQLFS
jgi:membrane protease YdiL (CAAX protease family)